MRNGGSVSPRCGISDWRNPAYLREWGGRESGLQAEFICMSASTPNGVRWTRSKVGLENDSFRRVEKEGDNVLPETTEA